MFLGEKLQFRFYHPSALLRVTGSDAGGYLQGQFTNELRKLESERGIYGLWLNQKGRVLADSFVCRKGASEEFLIASYFSSASVIRERLEAYVVADDVLIETAAEAWGAVSLLVPSGGPPSAPPGIIQFQGRRTEFGNVDWLFPLERKGEITTHLLTANASEISSHELEYLRIAEGIPAIPQDIGPTELPNEGALEGRAISYTKGCYLGQEVMARLKSMGKVRRRLLRVTINQERVPALPAPLFLERRQVGELRSAISDGKGRAIGLALLSLLSLRSESCLAFTAEGECCIQLADPLP
jgi:folate-binding protein YgfZ